ncbi:MAG: sigma-70 family RNA polymerase sigma factor [Planctomycetia bacterium]
MPAGETADPTAASLASLLLDWQATAEPGCLDRLVTTIRPLVERLAEATLHRHGIRDAFAVDEAVSLVLDHLRRLPGSPTGERLVKPFAPRHSDSCMCSLIDAGRSYVVWLARERAADVARARRRQARSTLVFSQLDKPAAARMRQCTATAADSSAEPHLCDRLREAITQLPPRERTVIELLLEGKSQAVIAHALEVCEGTVSRIRARALATLRDLLAE